MVPVTYRLAEAADRERIIEVCRTVNVDDYVIDDFEKWFGRGSVLLAERGTETLGMLRTSVLLDGSGWVSSVRVRSEIQSRGIGRALTAEALSRLGTGGVRLVRLMTSAANHRAIRSFGAAAFREETRMHVLVRDQGATKAPDTAPLAVVGITPDSEEVRQAPQVAAMAGLIALDYQILAPTPEAVESLARLGSLHEDATGSLAVVTTHERGGTGRLSIQPTVTAPAMYDAIVALAEGMRIGSVHCFVPKGTPLEPLLVRGFHLSSWAAEAVVMRTDLPGSPGSV